VAVLCAPSLAPDGDIEDRSTVLPRWDVDYALAVSLFQGINESAYDPTAPDGGLWFGGSFPPFYLPIFLLGMAVGRIFLFGPRLSTAAPTETSDQRSGNTTSIPVAN
jgi:hypothetical protein